MKTKKKLGLLIICFLFLFPLKSYGISSYQDYFKIKVDVDNTPSELWEMYISADGIEDEFSIDATSYTPAAVTYECALLLTDEQDSLANDKDYIVWVVNSTIITSQSGSSLANDVDTYAPCCNDTGTGACGMTGGGNCVWVGGAQNTFGATYGAANGDYTDQCSGAFCNMSVSETQYRPRTYFLCESVWRQCNVADAECGTYNGTTYACNGGVWTKCAGTCTTGACDTTCSVGDFTCQNECAPSGLYRCNGAQSQECKECGDGDTYLDWCDIPAVDEKTANGNCNDNKDNDCTGGTDCNDADCAASCSCFISFGNTCYGVYAIRHSTCDEINVSFTFPDAQSSQLNGLLNNPSGTEIYNWASDRGSCLGFGGTGCSKTDPVSCGKSPARTLVSGDAGTWEAELSSDAICSGGSCNVTKTIKVVECIEKADCLNTTDTCDATGTCVAGGGGGTPNCNQLTCGGAVSNQPCMCGLALVSANGDYCCAASNYYGDETTCKNASNCNIAACTANGGACAVNGTCCSSNCVATVCTAAAGCTANGGACAVNGTCCSSNCVATVCTAAATSVCDPNAWFLCNTLEGTVDDIFQAGETLIGYILGIIGSVALLLIIVSGVMYMTSMGNEEKITTSKKILTGAVIGLAIALLSYSLLQLVISIL